MPTSKLLPGTPEDGRRALGQDLARGVVRLMGDLGRVALREIPLANGRRADVMAVDAKGLVTIVEIKSCLADFQSDHKWEDYRPFCDVFFFAVPEDFPQDRIAADCGLIIADRHGGDLLREGDPHPLSGARRKAVLIRFGRMAAMRLTRLEDPGRPNVGERFESTRWPPAGHRRGTL